MIGTIDIELQAASPNMPLCPIFVFKDSWQSIRISGMPRSIGSWSIEEVFV